MTHEKFEGERTLMRIHIGESDKWHGKSLHEAIVELLRREGFSGATVLRGVGGYTTFSSFGWETAKMLEEGEWLRASTYVGASVIAGLLLSVAGIRLANRF